MFNRTAPRALALAFVLIAVVVAAIVLITGSLGTATAGQDGVPAAAHTVHACVDYADGTAPADDVNGACYLPTTYHGAPTLDTAAYGTDIPRCASDDFNADHVARCYTERVTDGAVLIIDASDTVIATLK
jgi:hypothetical protein